MTLEEAEFVQGGITLENIEERLDAAERDVDINAGIVEMAHGTDGYLAASAGLTNAMNVYERLIEISIRLQNKRAA